jgi:hypothetical protein
MDSEDMKTIESLMKLFVQALEYLYDKERDVVKSDVNERCMAAITFAFMKNKWNRCKRLRPYQLDYEYNREGQNGVPKRLYCKYAEDKKIKWHFIIPDLIVHVRGDVSGKKNLCVVEFKKFGIDSSDDFVKLEEMTRQDNEGRFRYKLGIHVVFGESLDATEFEVFINGQSIEKQQIGADVGELISMIGGCVKRHANTVGF